MPRPERPPEDRARGVTIWITGLPGAGKTTLAAAIATDLAGRGVPSRVLDGDEMRQGPNSDLGFSPADRGENIRRVAQTARLCCEQGLIAIVAVISPYRSGRRDARQLHIAAGFHFVEVFVDTPLAICEQRDPKGLYARFRSGELVGLTGIDAPYEPPRYPDLVVNGTDDHQPSDSAARVVQHLLELEIPPS